MTAHEASDERRVLTVGHGTLEAAEFAELVREADIELVVDIRSYPGSRRVPHFGREAMAQWLPEAGVGYRWARDLGGRRKSAKSSRHVAWNHPSFRSYADYMETDAFHAALGALVEQCESVRLAVMCSESVWWRCHRRMVADHLELVEGVPVEHLFHDGRLQSHPPMTAARVEGNDLVYDLVETVGAEIAGDGRQRE